MIGRLRGILLEKQPPWLLVDVGGVGYEVQAPMSTFYQLPDSGQEVILRIHMVVREDAQLLFGFADDQEREIFRTLLKVSGVGPKMALAVLSGMDIDDFVRCVREDDVAALTRLPGVGKKTAERLLVELRDTFKGWQQPAPQAAVASPSTRTSDAVAEAESALVALGYKPAEAARAILAVSTDDGVASAETLIRLALKRMVKK